MVAAVLGAMLPIILLATPAEAADPDHVGSTLEGCKFSAGQTLPQTSGPYAGKFICNDSQYTTGNLGKGWNELDIVPYRITMDAGNAAPATQTYTIAVALDAEDGGRPGYDVISAPVLNTNLSDAGCNAPTVGAETIMSPGLGGISKTRYRLVTITQSKNTECVYDYFGRLALGSHLFPGSSLHGNLALPKAGGGITTSGIGASDISIPVNEIKPQEISKNMTASRGSDHTWNIIKGASPATLNFGNSCDFTGASDSAAVDVTVTWTKNAANPSGPVTITTNVYATNPAARIVTVDATDRIYSGSDQTNLLDTKNFGPQDVPANTANFLLGTHTFVWNNPSGTTVNDVATATYTDKVTGVPIPGNTTASASATIQNNGPVTNGSAVINDTESITGQGLTFSVDSVTGSGAPGTFSNYPTLGAKVTGPVNWTSATQSGSGSVTFHKTVYAAKGSIEPAGKLTDTATLTGSDGFTTNSSATTDITVDTKAALTINKSIPNILQAGESATFTFKVKDSNGVVVATPSLTFGPGDTNKSTSVGDLPPDTYTVIEDPQTGWKAQPDATVNLTGAKCSGSANFDNAFNPAAARVKKVTVPAGFEKDWTFDLKQGANVLESATTTGAGFVNFTTQLGEGTYTIAEHEQDGWTNNGGSADCTFTVDLPGDAGKTFSCTYTNTYNPSITLDKEGDDLSKRTDDVTYDFTLTNTSSTGGAAGVPDLECTITDPTISYNSGAQTVAAGQTFTDSAPFTIPQNAPDPFPNEATASCTYPGLPDEVATASDSFNTNLFQPAVKITKTANKTFAEPGDVVTYTVTIENKSSNDSPNLVLDSFADTLVAGATADASCNSLAPGGSCTFTYDYTVQAGDPNPLNNTATVHYHPRNFPNDISDSASASVTVVHPSVTLTKIGDRLSKIGDSVSYLFLLENTSSAGTPDLVCTITDPKINYSSGPLTLATGDDVKTTASFTIPSNASDPFTNTATATCTFAGSNKVEATATSSFSTNLFQPSVTITKAANKANVQPNEDVTYTITISNTSSADSPNLVLDTFTDSKVAGVTPPGVCSPLAPGASCTFSYTYTVKTTDTSPFVNNAVVHYHPAGFPNDITASASASVRIIHPAFTVTKTCSTPTVPAGQTAIFTVDVNNTGDVPLAMTLSDTVALTNSNFTATQNSDVGNAALTFQNGNVKFNLASGAHGQFEISVTASGTSIENTITANGQISGFPGTSFDQTKTATDKCDVISGATRTIGFWRTHLSFLKQVLNTSSTLPSVAIVGTQPLGVNNDAAGTFKNGYIDLGCFQLKSVADVMGVFWADTSFNSNGKTKRSALCQAKVITAKQLLGAILNQSFSNAAPLPQVGGQDLITATINALKGTDKTLIKNLGQMLDDYNNSGDDVTAVIPGSLTIGKASPQDAKAIANEKVADC